MPGTLYKMKLQSQSKGMITCTVVAHSKAKISMEKNELDQNIITELTIEVEIIHTCENDVRVKSVQNKILKVSQSLTGDAEKKTSLC